MGRPPVRKEVTGAPLLTEHSLFIAGAIARGALTATGFRKICEMLFLRGLVLDKAEELKCCHVILVMGHLVPGDIWLHCDAYPQSRDHFIPLLSRGCVSSTFPTPRS